ncbi:MAG: CotH kinase family protein [Clostridia bacterium]|nr:CotH kinase family protein [Clostridia bacterium]
MKKILLLALAALLAMCCPAVLAEERGTARLLPLISIRTVDPREGTAFATEPVKAHVAEAIASWTPGYVIPPEPYYVSCTVSCTGAGGSADLDRVEAQVKVRGNWTTSYEKKPLRIKFGKKQSLCGLNGGRAFKNWVLLAEYKDLSMLRNKAGFDLAHKILGDGLYCSDCALVEVEINGEYWGVYLLAEQQECAEGRVNVPEPKKDETGADVGYFLEFDGYYTLEDRLHSFTINYANYAPLIPFNGRSAAKPFKPLSTSPDRSKNVGFTIKSSVRSENQRIAIRNFVANAYKIMYAAAYQDKALEMAPGWRGTVPSEKTPREAVEAVVDTDSLAGMYILSEITCDPDIYWSSFFISADLSESGSRKLRFEAPWDFDSSMGNRYVCVNAKGFHAANVVDDVDHVYRAINPWLAVLMQTDWFRDLIAEKWTALYDSGALSGTVEMIRADSRTYEAAFTRNYRRWSNMADKSPLDYELNREAFACRSEAESAEQLAHWLERRIGFLNDYWHR